MPLYPLNATSLLWYGLGGYDHSEVGGIHTHTLHVENTLPFFDMYIGKDLNEHEYHSGIVKSVSLDFEVNEPVLLTADCMFGREIAPQAVTPIGGTNQHAFPDYNIANRAFSGAEVTTQIAGSTVTTIEAASVEVNNTVVEDNFVLGDRYLPFAFIQEVECSGSLTLAHSNIAQYNYILNETTPSLTLTGSYGTGAGARSVTTTLRKLSFDTGNLPTEGNDRYILDLDFMGEPVAGTTTSAQSPIQVVVKNAQGEDAFKV